MSESESVVITGMEEMRDKLRTFVDAARIGGQHTVVERYGKPVAVLVPVEWYVRNGGDPRGPLPIPDDAPSAESAES